MAGELSYIDVQTLGRVPQVANILETHIDLP